MIYSIDFSDKKYLHRFQYSGRNQNLIKAAGIKNKKHMYPTIIDATAGLAKDAFQLAALGCAIFLIERNLKIFKNLKNAFNNAKKNPKISSVIDRIFLIFGDSYQIIPYLPRVDIIYLDPMFPRGKKKALSKKDSQYLHNTVNLDNDAKKLLELSILYAKKRVFLKRPKISSWISERKPTLQIIGKRNRFDIYLITK